MRCGEDAGTPFSAVTVPRPPPQHSTVYVAPEGRTAAPLPVQFPGRTLEGGILSAHGSFSSRGHAGGRPQQC